MSWNRKLFLLGLIALLSLALVIACGSKSSSSSSTSADDDATTTDDDDNDDNDNDNDNDDDNDDDAAPPQYPANHDASWNCLLCHATNLQNCAKQQPHGSQYQANQCTTCHTAGASNNAPCYGGHNWGLDCTTCHTDTIHGVTFTSKAQCLVCHGPGAGADL
jgi:hypothetical protein